MKIFFLYLEEKSPEFRTLVNDYPMKFANLSFSKVVDPRQVKIASDKLEKEPKRFTVRHEVDIPVQVPGSAGEGQLEATVLGPDQMSVPSTVTKENDGYHIRFVPRQTGQHKVMVMYGGKEVSGSPYSIRIRDSTNKRVKVKEMEQMRTGYSTDKEVCLYARCIL